MSLSFRLHRAAIWGLGLLLLALLPGCAVTRVDSEVVAFSRLPAAQLTGSYRFEQLPSQQAQAARQAQVEALAQPALQRVGLVRNDQAPRFSVQLLVNPVQTVRYGDDGFGWPASPYGPYGHGWGGWYGWGPAWRYGPWSPFYGPTFASPNPRYRHELTLLLRDLATQQVVFESRVAHEGLWSQSERLLPALIDAALRDFPNPPAGVRRVEVDLPPR